MSVCKSVLTALDLKHPSFINSQHTLTEMLTWSTWCARVGLTYHQCSSTSKVIQFSMETLTAKLGVNNKLYLLFALLWQGYTFNHPQGSKLSGKCEENCHKYFTSIVNLWIVFKLTLLWFSGVFSEFCNRLHTFAINFSNGGSSDLSNIGCQISYVFIVGRYFRENQ